MGATAAAVRRLPTPAILTQARAIPVVLIAFVASRLLALGGGMAGVLGLLAVVLGLALAALLACRRRLPAEYAAYAGVVLLACISTPAVGQPLWSLDRYTLTIFPLWMAAGAWLSGRRIALPAVVLCGSALLVFYAAQFASWAFVA